MPHGLAGGALARVEIEDDGSDDGDDDDDVDMDEEASNGWKEEYLQWWFDFLNEKGGKGVTKDTWIMVRHFPFSVSAYLLHTHGILSQSFVPSSARLMLNSQTMTRTVSSTSSLVLFV